MKIEPLSLNHERGAFRCGTASFDRYFRAQAGRDIARSLAAIFVVALPDGRIAGYCALSSATVLLPDLLSSGQRPISRYPELTAARLTKLAVDKRHRRQGYAALLLLDIEDRLRTSPLKPMAVIAEVHNDQARCFLEHAGFKVFTDQPSRAFRPLD